jgi:hypothetical protein
MLREMILSSEEKTSDLYQLRKKSRVFPQTLTNGKGDESLDDGLPLTMFCFVVNLKLIKRWV